MNVAERETGRDKDKERDGSGEKKKGREKEKQQAGERNIEYIVTPYFFRIFEAKDGKERTEKERKLCCFQISEQ